MIKYLIGIQVATALYLQFFQADEIFAPTLVLIHIIAGILVPIVYYGKSDIQNNQAGNSWRHYLVIIMSIIRIRR